MRKLFLFIIFIPFFGHSQILKVDKGRLDVDSSGFFLGSINIDFNINNRSATVDEDIVFTGLEGSSDLVYLSKKHAYILLNNINYFTSTGGPLVSTGTSHIRANFLRKRDLSYEVFTQVQYDDGRRMPFRYLQGGGLRFQVLETDKSEIHIGIGGMYEKERWKSTEVADLVIEKEIWKTSSYVNAKVQLNDYVDFNLISYYQAGHDNEDEVFRNRISGDAVITVKVSDRLSFLTSFTAQYEDKPIIPINNFVYSLTNGLKWSF